MKKYDVVFYEEAERCANTHLLQHYSLNKAQEDLCFALWKPSTGRYRFSGIIYKIILPKNGERNLHGNVAFKSSYLSRAIRDAVKEKAGLAFLHSHPTDGWQGMSGTDVIAERDYLTSPVMTTGLPLIGLTIGTDGYWSARIWKKEQKKINYFWCDKVRVVCQNSYRIYFNDSNIPPPKRKNILMRTFDTWGNENQNKIARLKIGIVGLGSVGCIVAESLARIGVQDISLFDPDIIKEHNLDRLLYGTTRNIGQYKVDVASKLIKEHATAKKINIVSYPQSIQKIQAYQGALDCDFLFSCVDRPVARDILNFISYAHLIPVIDGGVAVTTDQNQSFYSAHWRSHLVTPFHRCLRCNQQYTTSDVVSELDGSFDDTSYINNLPKENRNNNQNVFPFSLGIGSFETNMMIRYLISQDWWPQVQQQEYQFITGKTKIDNSKCRPNCEFQQLRIAKGDECKPHYLDYTQVKENKIPLLDRISRIFTKIFGKEY